MGSLNLGCFTPLSDNISLLLIGGSAGSLPIVVKILTAIPDKSNLITVIVLHRLKSVLCGMAESISVQSHKYVHELNDKDYLTKGGIYLAPANYHLVFDSQILTSLTIDMSQNNSTPSIDVTFVSGALNFGADAAAVLLSGANEDGANGLAAVHAMGGQCYFQVFEEALVTTMPKAGKKFVPSALPLTDANIKYLFY